MLNNKDYCDYETCVALKDLGFKDSTEYYYANNGEYTTTHDNWHSEYTQCWSLYEAQKWLREVKKLHITIFSQSQESWQYRITKQHQKLEDGLHGEDFASYEDALAEGIKEAVKRLKEEG